MSSPELPPPKTLWSAQRALVIGGSGFLGGAIVRLLLKRGCGKVTVYNRSEIAPELLGAGVRCSNGDLNDKVRLGSAVRAATLVFHVAAKTGLWGNKEEFIKVNVGGTQTLLDILLELDSPPPLIHTGSPSVVYDARQDALNLREPPLSQFPEQPFSIYSATKCEAEKRVRNSVNNRLKTVVVRPHVIYGPGDPHILKRIVAKARANRLIQIGNGENWIDMTFVDNAAWAHLCAAEALLNPSMCECVNGRGYTVTDQQSVQPWKWVSSLLYDLGLPGPRLKLNRTIAYALGRFFESVTPSAGEPPLTRFAAAQLSHSHTFDPRPAQGELGYFPIVEPAAARELTLNALRRELVPS